MVLVSMTGARRRHRQAAVNYAGLGLLVIAITFAAGLVPRSRTAQLAELGIGAIFIVIFAVLIWRGWWLLSALLVYGYPALAVTLLLGALGLPVPTGLATTLAGSLIARGHMNWLIAAVLAVTASVIGDAIGYGIGRGLGERFLKRRGRWFGYTPARRARVQMLFDRWGGLTVLISRTLVSHLSSIVSLLAGIGRYRPAGFLAFAVAGRIVWASAYLGLGYGIGSDLEAATGFLSNLTGLLVSFAILVVSGLVARRRRKIPPSNRFRQA